jgi:hypothetical protein
VRHPALGPFLCLRNHAGKGVQQVNEGIPARWTLAAEITAINLSLFAFTADNAALHFLRHRFNLCSSTNADL